MLDLAWSQQRETAPAVGFSPYASFADTDALVLLERFTVVRQEPDVRFVALDPTTDDRHEPLGDAFPPGEHSIFRRRITPLLHAAESSRAGLGQCSGMTPERRIS